MSGWMDRWVYKLWTPSNSIITALTHLLIHSLTAHYLILAPPESLWAGEGRRGQEGFTRKVGNEGQWGFTGVSSPSLDM